MLTECCNVRPLRVIQQHGTSPLAVGKHNSNSELTRKMDTSTDVRILILSHVSYNLANVIAVSAAN